MPVPKLDSKILKRLEDSFLPHTRSLYDRLGSSVVAIVELTSVERAETAAEEEKAPTVKLRVTGLEIATRDQEDALRRAQQAMFQLRTTSGTLAELDSEQVTRHIARLPNRIVQPEE
ncbi:hypothetical protein [Nonomuraea helvata]|uniref:Uncharacterized protein n=1 Tax=Nonomuraea helvata TaxID=37484 RepID=A0ABV5SHZ0_9ACTN